ncbi:MAG: hypothetical protein K6F88_03675 [Ruminococcus sp.]|nr:hypothetical protein [Ruminococcus sp.]
MKNVNRILGKWGEKASITKNGKNFTADVLIQPMNRRWKTYLSGERVPSGILNNNHYYMIAAPELDLDKPDGGIVECGGKKYYIRSSGDFKVKNNKLYVWAVLAAHTEPVEGDYD